MPGGFVRVVDDTTYTPTVCRPGEGLAMVAVAAAARLPSNAVAVKELFVAWYVSETEPPALAGKVRGAIT
jgi:hypothetical protein